MGLLSELGLPSKLPGNPKPVATTTKTTDVMSAEKGTGKPTVQQVAAHKEIVAGLRGFVPQVKELAAGKDVRAGEAAKLARETGGLLSWETLEKAKEKFEALKEDGQRTQQRVSRLVAEHRRVPECVR
jgi:hypothetical protein